MNSWSITVLNDCWGWLITFFMIFSTLNLLKILFTTTDLYTLSTDNNRLRRPKPPQTSFSIQSYLCLNCPSPIKTQNPNMAFYIVHPPGLPPGAFLVLPIKVFANSGFLLYLVCDATIDRFSLVKLYFFRWSKFFR